MSCVMTVNFKHYLSKTEIDLQAVKERDEKKRNEKCIFCSLRKKCCLKYILAQSFTRSVK